MHITVTVNRGRYFGSLFLVSVYFYAEGKTIGLLKTPREILDLIRSYDPIFVHFYGGGRPTKTHQRKQRRK